MKQHTHIVYASCKLCLLPCVFLVVLYNLQPAPLRNSAYAQKWVIRRNCSSEAVLCSSTAAPEDNCPTPRHCTGGLQVRWHSTDARGIDLRYRQWHRRPCTEASHVKCTSRAEGGGLTRSRTCDPQPPVQRIRLVWVEFNAPPDTV